MKTKMSFGILLAMVVVLATTSAPVFPESEGSRRAADGDVEFELIGQVINPSPTTSIQFGYLTFINEPDLPLFNPGPQNETTALFTFFNDTLTERVINNGPIRIINRVGTTTIYLDTTPDGNFANSDTFRDGMPVQTSVLRHQVIIDTITGSFTTTFVNVITSVEPFRLGNHVFRLGKAGRDFRTTVLGHLNTPGPPAAHIAGFAVGPDLTR